MIRKLYMALIQYLHDSKLRLRHDNIEGVEDFNLNFSKKRKHGLSAMMRIKNEEKWIKYSILSIIDYVDEIVIILQNSEDNTKNIIESINSPKVKLYEYPFNTFPVEENYSRHDQNSVYNLAYYYNFALSKTKFSYVWKFDGDQCAIENRVKSLKELVDSRYFDIIHFKGYDIWGEGLRHLCLDPYTSNEPLIFKVNERTFYFGGNRCEEFTYPVFKSKIRKSKIFNIETPVFLHFKYATEIEGKGWSKNWNNSIYFKDFIKSKDKGKIYDDDYPKILLDNKIIDI